MAGWSIDKSKQLYGIRGHRNKLLDITSDGKLHAKIRDQSIALTKVVEDFRREGVSSAVVRIPDWIRSQMHCLHQAFATVITKKGYSGEYYGVYPIKVNQMRDVVEWVAQYGKELRWGFEAGTKPELVIALSQQLHMDAYVICNGVKDRDYIELALLATKAGWNVIIVLDSPNEAQEVVKVYEDMRGDCGWHPRLGVRVKTMAMGTGVWEESGGREAKFGLNTFELVNLLNNQLLGKEKWLELLHFHIGSQITDIERVKEAVAEVARIYAELKTTGRFSQLDKLNIGGGLAVDYEGTRSTSSFSANYDFAKYARVVVSTIKKVIEEVQVTSGSTSIPEPNILSESGRAIVTHHSLVLIKVIEDKDRSYHLDHGVLERLELEEFDFAMERVPDCIRLLSNLLKEIRKCNSIKELAEIANKLFKERLRNPCKKEALYLEQKNDYESVYSFVERKIAQKFKMIAMSPSTTNLSKRVAEIFRPNKSFRCTRKWEGLERILSAPTKRLVGNFSVFDQMLDVPGCGQYFPVLPTQGLDEKPDYVSSIADITCDSGGELSQFHSILREDDQTRAEWSDIDSFFTRLDSKLMCFPKTIVRLKGIPVHAQRRNEDHYLAVLFTGAYQDVLATKHNLLGRLAEIVISVDDDEMRLVYLRRRSQSSGEILATFNYDIQKVAKRFKGKKALEKAIRRVITRSSYLHHV